MNETGQSLLRSILARPDDDLPRLIFADWLDEHGEGERAEFIRLQVQLVGHPAHHAAETGCPFRRRERELLIVHGNKWLCQSIGFSLGVHLVPATDGGGATYRRGFVAEVTLSWQDWLVHHKAILESCPIRNAKDGLVRLADAPVLRTHQEPAGWVYRVYGTPDSSHDYPLATCLISRADILATRNDPRLMIELVYGVILHIVGQAFPGVRFQLPPAGRLAEQYAL